MKTWIIAAAMLLAATATAHAETTLVKAARIIDPATGTVRQNGAILITDGRIVAISDSGMKAPEGATVVDLGDMWLTTGLMDTHSHLAGDAIADKMADESDATYALIALRNAKEMLAGGFTTVRDLGHEGNYAVSAVRREIEKGAWDGPTILNAGKTIAPYGGDRDRVSPLPFSAGPTWRLHYIDADNPDEAVKAVRQNIRYGAKVIKLYADIHPYYLSREDVAAAVAEARRAGIKVAAHVRGGPAADNVIAGGVDSIEHGFGLTRAQMVAMKEKGITLSGTDFDRHSLDIILRDDAAAARFEIMIRERLRLAHTVGVRLAFGSDTVWSDGDRPRGQIVLDQTATWVSAGIPPRDILQAMTIKAATLLGVEKERGLLREGQFADLIAMPSNPLADISALRGICFVMKEGRIVRSCN